MRLTVKKHHQQYLQNIANQMNVDDVSEALNILIWELRKINYAFGSPLPQYPIPNDQQPQKKFVETQATVMSGLDWQPQSYIAIQEFESAQIAEEIDPIIEKLIAAGLESF